MEPRLDVGAVIDADKRADDEHGPAEVNVRVKSIEEIVGQKLKWTKPSWSMSPS